MRRRGEQEHRSTLTQIKQMNFREKGKGGERRT